MSIHMSPPMLGAFDSPFSLSLDPATFPATPWDASFLACEGVAGASASAFRFFDLLAEEGEVGSTVEK